MTKKIMTLTIATLLAMVTWAENEHSYITVTGQSEISMVPENVLVNVPLSNIDKNYNACYTALVNRTEKIKKELLAAGVDKKNITIQDLSVRKSYEYINGKQTDRGFEGSVNLTIKGTFTNSYLNSILTIMTQNNCFYNVNFALSDKQNKELRLLALDGAMQDAYANARQLAKSGNVGVGEIVSIDYGDTSFSPSFPMYRKAYGINAMETASQNMELTPSPLTINKQIVVKYRLLTNL